MEVFTSKPIYKAKTPLETICTARSILTAQDIFLKETLCLHSESGTGAAELRFGDEAFQNVRVATNGKGMTLRYALASAYGEFMERLQCQILLSKYLDYAWKEGDIPFQMAPDEVEIPAGEMLIQCGDFLRSMFHPTEDAWKTFCEGLDGVTCRCLPFYDCLNRKQVMIPYWALSRLITSNGTCAGNVPREAVAQGISELYERQSLMMIYRDNPPLPQLPQESFSDTEILKKLKNLDAAGFSVQIIDASMGLNYPVIGLILQSEDGLMMNLGADPNPIVALERCLTESYQVITEEAVRKRFSKDSCGTFAGCRNFFERDYYYLQLVRSRTYGSGEKPDNVHHTQGVSEHYTWNREKENDYVYLRELTRSLGYSLFVRDCSWLGFPAYISLIPQISLGDYQTDNFFPLLGKILRNEFPVKEPEAYKNMVPILQRLAKVYQNNIPNQSALSELL